MVLNDKHFSALDRLNTSNMDESHYQSLDEDKRRCSDEGQGKETKEWEEFDL